MVIKGLREESLNVTLAGLLAERGLNALGEIRWQDVRIELNGVIIVIEGKKPGPGKRRELLDQAERRLEEGACHICAMVEYAEIKTGKLQPTQEDVKEALINGRYNVAFMTLPEAPGLERWSKIDRTEVTKFREANLHELITYLMSAYEKTISEDMLGAVVEKLENRIRGFGRNVLLSGDVIQRLKEVLELRKE